MNLYEIDSRTRKILHSENFLEGLSVTEFIEEISKEHEISLKESKNNEDNLEQLDPKPFIRTFEGVLNELKGLKKRNTKQLASLENEVVEYELYHSQKVINLSNQIQAINNKFSGLESVVSDVGSIINPLGEKLQVATNLKEKNVEIIFLTKCYNDFFKYNQSKMLIDLQNSRKSADKKNCGKYISKLLKLAKKLASDSSMGNGTGNIQADSGDGTSILNNDDRIVSEKRVLEAKKKFQKVYQEIEKFANNFQENLLREFSTAYNEENVLKMKESFDILIDFNENSMDVYDTYLSKIEFLGVPSPEEEFMANDQEFLSKEHEFWKVLSDPVIHYNSEQLANYLPQLENLFSKFKNLVINQFNLIKIIFNKSRRFFLKLFDLFLRKIFQKKLNNLTVNMLNFAQSLNNLSYVRLLHMIYITTASFAREIKEFFQENYTKVYLEDALIKKSATSELFSDGSRIDEKTLSDDLKNLVDLQFNELFFHPLTEKNYIEKEKKSLEEIYSNINTSFEQKHSRIFKDKALAVRLATTDSVKESTLLSPLSSPSLGSALSKSGSISNGSGHNLLEKNRLIQLRTYMKSKLERTSSSSSKFSSLNDSLLLSPKLDDMNGIFSEMKDDLDNDDNFNGEFGDGADADGNDVLQHGNLEIKFAMIDFMIQNSVESLSRISDLKPLNIPEYSLEILRILIFGVGSYLEFGLEVSYYRLIHLDFKKNEFLNFGFLRIINKANKILKLLTDFIKLIVLPLVVNNSEVKKKIISLTNGYLTTCELCLNIILKDSVELVINKIQFYLDKQKKKDFNVTNRKLANSSNYNDDGDFINGEFNNEDTETCQSIIKFLNNLYSNQLVPKRLLTNSNLTNFLIEIGINLLNLLVNHLKKFQINEIGGIILTKDIISYQALIDSWGIEELSERFSILRELANLFTVQPNYINSLIKEGQLANLNPDIIQQYVGKRADYNSSFLNKFGSFI